LARFYSFYTPYKLDVAAMKKAAKSIEGKHDFKSFQAKDKIERPSIRRINSVKIAKKGDFIYIDIQANGFLYKMVRNIVGTLFDVGRGRIKCEDVKKILSAKDRTISGPTLPAKGLCLVDIKY
jgi:tRNA pseudouridine38-40 synthase